MDDEQNKSEVSYDATEPRSRRHLASLAASIVAHVAIVGLIVCFASPLARTHSEWVLAYLVEGTDGASGHVGARTGASVHAGAVSTKIPESISADQRKRKTTMRKAHRRIEVPKSEVASLAPVRSVASARPSDSGDDERPRSRDAASPGDAAASSARAVGIDSVGTAAGGGVAVGDGGGDRNSMAHADYARNPPPVYPALARRREQHGTVTVRVLVGADGSVESAEVAESSGFDTLDNAALETVRSRWRFVPARRDGVAVESWVLVPIRFALIEANAIR